MSRTPAQRCLPCGAQHVNICTVPIENKREGRTFSHLRKMSDRNDFDRRIQGLCIAGRLVGGRRLNFSNDIHTLGDLAERGERLTVWIAGAAKVERRLVANADKEIGSGTVRAAAAMEIVPSL